MGPDLRCYTCVHMSGQRVAAKRLTAVGYVRVSSRQQLDGYWLDVQETAVRAYAKDHRLTLVELFREEGISGTVPVTERPALMSALEFIRASSADVLLGPNLFNLAPIPALEVGGPTRRRPRSRQSRSPPRSWRWANPHRRCWGRPACRRGAGLRMPRSQSPRCP